MMPGTGAWRASSPQFMTLSLAAWFVVTAGHFLLTSRAIARLPDPPTTVDERLWTATLASVGALSLVLHGLALTIGITLVGGIVALGTWHAVLLRLTAGRTRTGMATPPDWRRLVAATAVLAVLVSWLDLAGRSASVDGTDAAHYHVPNAVNFALGASPFDLPATQHLYPMAGSVIAAWFIVPLSSPLLIDLAMMPAFLLTAASMNWIFRVTTGLSGLVWATWLTLALFSTPLFRMSSLVSADLWFTAGYMALVACLVAGWTRRSWRPRDLLAAAAALGLLAGSKTSGAPAAALLLAVWAAAELMRAVWTRQRVTLPRPLAATMAGALTVAIGTGGVWLIRNWITFGSPLAPGGLTIAGLTVFPGDALQPTTYLSVLGDMRQSESYDAGRRALRYIRLWLGWWFLPALVPTLLVALDLAAVAIRRVWDARASARLMCLVLLLIPSTTLLYLLIGAPWTSLEWTRGLSLRYVLPLFSLAALLSAVGLFPLTITWYRDRDASTLLLAAAAGTAIWLLISSASATGPRSSPIPPAEVVGLLVAVALVGSYWWTARMGVRAAMAQVVTCLATVTAVWAPATVSRDLHEQSTRGAGLAAERAAPRETIEPHRVPLLVALDHEDASGAPCVDRRFFSLSRFDLPLALQDPRYRTQVFYAGRDVETAAASGPLARCDYVIASPAVMGTDKGHALLAALAGGTSTRQLASTSDVLVFGR